MRSFQSSHQNTYIPHLLQVADGTDLPHECPIDAVHPPVNTDVRPAHDHVGSHLGLRNRAYGIRARCSNRLPNIGLTLQVSVVRQRTPYGSSLIHQCPGTGLAGVTHGRILPHIHASVNLGHTTKKQ